MTQQMPIPPAPKPPGLKTPGLKTLAPKTPGPVAPAEEVLREKAMKRAMTGPGQKAGPAEPRQVAEPRQDSRPPQPRQMAPRTQLRGLVLAAACGVLLLLGGLASASLLPIRGAVIASGQILVQGNPQPVQSLDPGIVAEVAVGNGDRVEAGELVLALDPTLARSQLGVAMDRLAQVLAEEDRLIAEAEGRADLRFDLPDLPFAPPDMREAISRQEALFGVRARNAAEGQRRLTESDAQLAAQIAGVEAETAAAEETRILFQQEIATQQALAEKGLVRQVQLNELLRNLSQLSGSISSLQTERTRLEAARREAALALQQEESQRAEQVARDLRDVTGQVQELIQQIVSLQAGLARTELRAPVSGIVSELAVQAPGPVISAGQKLAEIVPDDRAMEVEVSVDPSSIDQVQPGQKAEVIVTAFDPRSVPKLAATVQQVPPNASLDSASGRSFYRVTLVLDPQSTAQLPAGGLRAGMPVEAFLTTRDRPILSWLVAPLLKPLRHALRED